MKRRRRTRGRARIPANTEQNFRNKEFTRTRIDTDSKDFAGPKTLAQIKEEKLRGTACGEQLTGCVHHVSNLGVEEKETTKLPEADASDRKPRELSPGSEIGKVELLQTDGYASGAAAVSISTRQPMEDFECRDADVAVADVFVHEESSTMQYETLVTNNNHLAEDTTMKDAVDDLRDECRRHGIDDDDEDDFCATLAGMFSC